MKAKRKRLKERQVEYVTSTNSFDEQKKTDKMLHICTKLNTFEAIKRNKYENH